MSRAASHILHNDKTRNSVPSILIGGTFVRLARYSRSTSAVSAPFDVNKVRCCLSRKTLD